MDNASDLIEAGKRIVAFTGAGISEESGIPTFRGKGGLWDRYPPSFFANIPGLILSFLLRPKKLKSFIMDVIETFTSAKPNAGHYALAEMEKKGNLQAVITQNIDRLHESAGSRNVIKLHGDFFRMRCLRCGKTSDTDESEWQGILEKLKMSRRGRIGLLRFFRKDIPRCGCGGMRRPDVVFFGESLPRGAWMDAVLYAQSCDVLLVIGTSGVVYPAAGIITIAQSAGAKIIEINPEETFLSRAVDCFMKGKAGEVLPDLIKDCYS